VSPRRARHNKPPKPSPARPPQEQARTRAGPSAKVRRFVERLTREERLLVVLKRELYEGSWDDMVADLTARLEGRPYIFKLVHRIEDDLERIARLRKFEAEHDVDLADHVELEGQPPRR